MAQRARIVFVDLERREAAVDELDERILWEYIGGRALAHYLALKAARKRPTLVVAPGALTGIVSWAPKTTILALDEIHERPCEGVIGGLIGCKVRASGFSALVVTGRSRSMCYLVVSEERVKVVEAEYLRGAQALDVIDYLKRIYPGSSVAAVGPAAEKGLPCTCLVVDGVGVGCACGLGSFMASMGLKALVVAPGPPADLRCRSSCPYGCCKLEVRGGTGFEHLRALVGPAWALAPSELLAFAAHLANQLSLDYRYVLEALATAAVMELHRAAKVIEDYVRTGTFLTTTVCELDVPEKPRVLEPVATALSSLGLCAYAEALLKRGCEELSRSWRRHVALGKLLSLKSKVDELYEVECT